MYMLKNRKYMEQNIKWRVIGDFFPYMNCIIYNKHLFLL